MSRRPCNLQPSICGVKGAAYAWDDRVCRWQRLGRSDILGDVDAHWADTTVVYGHRGPAPDCWDAPDELEAAGCLVTTWRDARASLTTRAPARPAACATTSRPPLVPATVQLAPHTNPLADAWRAALTTGDEFAVQLARRELCRRYAWAIPDEAALTHIAELGPVVELGAGSGYWAALLADRGVDVVCYDAAAGEANSYHPDAARYHAIHPGGPDALAQHGDRALLLCWPPYDEPVAYDALASYPGDTVIYVGEDYQGCTGDARFHRRLAREFDCVLEHEIPSWPGIHDTLRIYRRR